MGSVLLSLVTAHQNHLFFCSPRPLYLLYIARPRTNVFSLHPPTAPCDEGINMQHEIKTINQDISARINNASAVASMSLPPPSAREKEGQEQKKFISNPEGIEDMFVTCDCLVAEHVIRVAKSERHQTPKRHIPGKQQTA